MVTRPLCSCKAAQKSKRLSILILELWRHKNYSAKLLKRYWSRCWLLFGFKYVKHLGWSVSWWKEIKCTLNRKSGLMQQQLLNWALQDFFPCSDRWCSQLENLNERHYSQDVLALPRQWHNVRRPCTERLLQHTISTLYNICGSLFDTLQSTQHPDIKQAQRSNGCPVHLLSNLWHMGNHEIHSYIFLTD